MSRRAASAAALVATVLASAGEAVARMHDHTTGGTATVSIGFAAFGPARIDVLAGDTVSWMNDSARAHTVTAEDGAFASEPVPPGDMYQRRYDMQGAYRYYCRLHPFMRGEIDAHDLMLDAPAGAAAPNRPLLLSGRAALPAGTVVSLEGDSGAGYTAAGGATVGEDGSFAAAVRPDRTTTYRAVHDSSSSPPVQVVVIDHRVRAVAARHGDRAVVVTARVTPAAAGSTVVLQLRLHERFGWWPVRRARLDRASRARFVVHRPGRVRARVVLTRPDGVTELARSAALSVGVRPRVSGG